jgi:hypothetical protein
LKARGGPQLIGTIEIRQRRAQQCNLQDVATGAEDLVKILHGLPHQVCTSPHDYIYSVLGLIDRSSLPEYLAPNYHIPYQQVFEQYSKFLITTTGDLSLLNSDRSKLESVPTCVPDFQHLYYSQPPKTRGIISCSIDGELLVQGVKIDELVAIDKARDAFVDDLVSVGKALKSFESEILLHAGQIRGKSIEVMLEEWFEFLESVWMFEENSTSITYAILNIRCPYESLINTPQEVQNRTSAAEVLCVEAADHLKYWFLTKTGLLGWLSPFKDLPKEGDIVCALKGSDFYVLLRPEGVDFRFVGTCR